MYVLLYTYTISLRERNGLSKPREEEDDGESRLLVLVYPCWFQVDTIGTTRDMYVVVCIAICIVIHIAIHI